MDANALATGTHCIIHRLDDSSHVGYLEIGICIGNFRERVRKGAAYKINIAEVQLD